MNIFNRYMLKQLGSAVVLSLLLFIFVLVTGNVFRQVLGEFINGRISIAGVFEVIALISISVIPYAMPLGMLTGVLLVLGKMSSSNEILAMKAAGMNLWRIVSPIFFIAFIGVIITGYINCYWAPQAANRYKTILKSTFKESPTKLIVEKTLFKEFPGYYIFTESKVGETLKGFSIWELNKEGAPFRYTYASEATIRFQEAKSFKDEDRLNIILKNAITEERTHQKNDNLTESQLRVSGIGEAPISISLGKILGEVSISKERKKLKWFTLDELNELRSEGWRVKPDDSPELKFADKISVQMQMQNYLTSAMSVFSLAILGIPLGIRVSRSETFVNIGVALGLALCFYLLMTFVSWIENPYLRPDILIWAPNILYQIIGFILLRKAAKN